MAGLMRDLRCSVHALLARPGLTLIAVLTLALGIGATAAVFTVVNGVLLRPLPYPKSDRLIDIRQTWQEDGPGPTTPPNFRDWRERARTFESMAAYYRGSANISGDGPPERLHAGFVTAGFFTVIRARPSHGRGFEPQEDRPEADPVVVISHGLWKRRFGGEEEILGRPLRLNGEPHTIVGVAPVGFGFPGDTDVWTPAAFDYDNESRSFGYIQAVGRLAPTISLDQAKAEMEQVAAQLEREYPEHNTDCDVVLEVLGNRLVGSIRPALWMLLGSVALVLLVAAANVTSLLLARATTRQRELAIRQALGASRFGVARLSVIESLILSLCGGSLGLALASLGTDALLQAFSSHIPRAAEIGLDGHVLVFIAIVSIATGVGAGLIPALQVPRGTSLAPLQESGRSVAGSVSSSRALRALVVSEVAMAVVLLIGAGLLMRSFANLVAVDPGFAGESVLVVDLELADTKYEDEQQRASFYRDMLGRLRALPEVEAASSIFPVPLDGGFTVRLAIDGIPVINKTSRPRSEFRVAGPDYFETMGITRIKGRVFQAGDTIDSPLVAVVNHSFVERFFPDGDALERRITFDRDSESEDADWFTIVGVVGDVRGNTLDSQAGAEIYVCSTQVPYSHASLVARTRGEPEALADAMRSAVLAVDNSLPVFNIRTMSDIKAGSLGRTRFIMALLGLFAAIALLLANIGVYGVLSYSVNQRTREVGIRMALGARRAQVLEMVVRQGMASVVAGLAIGLTGAVGLTSLLSRQVFGISTRDPLTFGAVATTFLMVAVIASALPAVRMTRIDSATVLRRE